MNERTYLHDRISEVLKVRDWPHFRARDNELTGRCRPNADTDGLLQNAELMALSIATTELTDGLWW